MNQMDAKLNDLPELPFELILGYLSLEDRIKCRAISRKWRKTIDSFRPKDLCFSVRASGFIKGKARWVSGAFARNFISSTRFELFVQTFGHSILANLKHLRICDLRLNSESVSTAFFKALNSFGRLEKLDIIRFDLPNYSDSACDLELNLPVLSSLQLEEVWAIKKLTLDAPKLQDVKILGFYDDLIVDLIHGESVERLVIDRLGKIGVKKMKNLKILYTGYGSSVDSTLLSDLEQLKEIHLYSSGHASKLFEQKQRYGRDDLKIFLCGLLLDGPNDPTIGSLSYDFPEETLASLAANPSRLAQEIPFIDYLDYPDIERAVPRGSEIGLLKRFTDLNRIFVNKPVQDIERFLQILKNMDIVELWFECDQPQDLFDRLPEHWATLQILHIVGSTLSDFSFLPKLKNLTKLVAFFPIDIKSVRKILEGLQFLLEFRFDYLNNWVAIEVKHHLSAKWFKVDVVGEETEVPDLEAAIRFIVETGKK